MTSATARMSTSSGGSRRLFAQIGEFLEAQRLEPDPANYAFAFNVVGSPAGPLAKAVAALTDGGVRLTVKEIEDLGVEVSTSNKAADRARADGLVAQTQMQVEGFHDVVAGLHAETQGFGRDLAAGADAIRAAAPSGGAAALEELARITAAMVTRVQSAEAQLEQATREAAELRGKLEQARDNALRDPLTDLPNRRAFEERFAADAATGEPVWMAVCDVDHFKSVNDRFGHSVGDRVLKAIGAALSEACAGHFVARYGGEEFVVLLRGLDGGAARAMMEAARVTVENKRYKLRESDQPLGAVTISSGLSLARAGEGVRTVFGRADALLYRAKSDGRNCVRVD
jgi:diguanylate cyclase